MRRWLRQLFGANEEASAMRPSKPNLLMEMRVSVPTSKPVLKTVRQPSTHDSTCPSCNAPLGRVPKRGSTCKSCGLNFVVRSTNRVFERTVLTESDGQALDWMMKIVQQYRVPIEEFAAAVQGIERKPMKPRDAVWQAWQLLLSQKKWEIYHDAIYRDMATFAYEEKRNWRPYLELAVQANLNRALQASSSGVEIENLARIETCSACSADVGKKFSRREVLGKKPLPHLDCECELRSGFVGICQCTYESLLDF